MAARKPSKPAMKGAKAAPAPVISRARGTSPVASAVLPGSAPTPAEVRAEREPAVTVNVPSQPDVTDWAPPPAQTSWLDRMLGRDKREKSVMADHMAAVKAGVLQELETMGQKKGVAVKGSPFATVLLPTAKPKKPWKWMVLGVLALVVVGVMVWVGRKPEQPEHALSEAMAAVRNQDVRSFEARVDVAGVATSVVNQMFNIPQQPQGELAARMTSFVKPGLADSLKDEILATVSGEKLDDSGNTLLGKIWHVLGGDALRVGSARIAMQDERMAVAEVPLRRSDLNLVLPLQVLMAPTEAGGWQVVDMPNLAAVLDTVAQAERIAVEQNARLQAAADAAQAAGIRVESVKKAKDNGRTGSNNLIVSMVVINDGAHEVQDVPLDVAFGDAAGQPMMTTRLTLDGELGAGSRREQVWSVPIDRARAAERYVADLPLSALTVTVTVVK